jgi:hypothetical protein
VKSRPIPFSPAMVRASRNDAKSQTRRIANPQPDWLPEVRHARFTGGFVWPIGALGQQCGAPITKLPYGQPGDRLWVREEHRTLRFNRDTREAEVEYTEDGSRRTVTLTEREAALFVGRKFPFAQTRARFMYRSYSRITLEITSVRVERLQDISEADAVAEGVERNVGDAPWTPDDGWLKYPLDAHLEDFPAFTAKDSYRTLWESINGAGSWDANPYVWVVAFKRVEGGASC